MIRFHTAWVARLWAPLFLLLGVQATTAQKAAPLVIGDTFTIDSRILGETGRINVYLPPGYSGAAQVPVLYMPDGGLAEDFLHVAGLVQVVWVMGRCGHSCSSESRIHASSRSDRSDRQRRGQEDRAARRRIRIVQTVHSRRVDTAGARALSHDG